MDIIPLSRHTVFENVSFFNFNDGKTCMQDVDSNIDIRRDNSNSFTKNLNVARFSRIAVTWDFLRWLSNTVRVLSRENYVKDRQTKIPKNEPLGPLGSNIYCKGFIRWHSKD